MPSLRSRLPSCSASPASGKRHSPSRLQSPQATSQTPSTRKNADGIWLVSTVCSVSAKGNSVSSRAGRLRGPLAHPAARHAVEQAEDAGRQHRVHQLEAERVVPQAEPHRLPGDEHALVRQREKYARVQKGQVARQQLCAASYISRKSLSIGGCSVSATSTRSSTPPASSTSVKCGMARRRQQQPDDRRGRERERVAVQRKDGKGRERKACAEQHA